MADARDQQTPDWLSPTPGGFLLSVWAQPGARVTMVQGILDGCLKLKLAAPPVDGKANEALLKWVAQRADLPLRAITLVAGQTSRRKRLRIECALPRERLAPALLGEP